MTEDRLDRAERIINALAEATQANTQNIDRIGQQHEADYERLRAEQAELRDQRERDEQDWRNDRATMQRAITKLTDNVTALVETFQTTIARVDATIARVDRMQDEVTTLQGQTQDTINQVRDLQVQGNRIMERLERLDGERGS